MKKTAFLAAALFAATTAHGAENGNGPAQVPYNCDFAPSCEVAPGIYGNLNAPATSKFNLSVGGFIKLDYAYNSVNFGHNYSQMSPQALPKTSSLANQRDQSVFSARQSRIWLKANGPALLGAKTSSLLEFDFQDTNAAATTDFLNPSPRLRHAYANLDWGKTQFLFGQTADIFGLAIASTIDFRGNGGTGFPGTRNPQLRVTHRLALDKNNSIKILAGVQTPYQDNNSITNTKGGPGGTNGTPGTAGAAGDTWGALPNFAGQVLFISKALGVSPGAAGLIQNPFTAGFFGIYGNQDVNGNARRVDTWGIGFYTFVPLISSTDGKSREGTLTFEGQIYEAANLVTVAGTSATAASLVGTPGNLTAAKGYGLGSQLIYYPVQDLGISVGYGRRGALNYATYKNNSNFEKFNESLFANASYDLNAALRIAVEYQHLKTQYGNPVNVTANNGTSPLAGTSDFGQANVGRLAFYYFF
ncbi:hypothetical protein [Geotalea sp. SG265]|uniref:hypothetical protein n=1 Tax=Geotalea sp. SG265 TaxID=2922867 RepID=UPI001FAE93DA|nr:hypothetical protein [Geotalea sp. SG265]